MNICYVAHESNLTGANQSLLDILSCTKEYGIKPFVIIPREGPIEQELIKNNIDYQVVMYRHDIKSSYIRNLFKIIMNKIAVYKIKRLIKNKEIDILHNNSFLTSVGMIAAYKSKIPYVCHIRDFGKEDHNMEFINEDMLFNYAIKSNKVIAISKAVYNKFTKKIPEGNIRIIYNGVNLLKYKFAERNILNGKVIKLLLAGRICEGKGQLEAVKAIEYLVNKGKTDIELYIVGDGVKGELYQDNLIEYIKNRKLEKYIKIMPFMNDLSKMRKMCDIGLVCSVNEAFGRVTIESMLASQLVIGANTGGTLELIDNNKYGLLYNQGDYKDLANKIKYAIDNKEEMNLLTKKSYYYASQKFSILRTMDEINQLYLNILQDR